MTLRLRPLNRCSIEAANYKTRDLQHRIIACCSLEAIEHYGGRNRDIEVVCNGIKRDWLVGGRL
jgi:hypothetical protein